jgi:predicted TIM-barrel fold metal-dependent hydrolase
MGKRRIISLDNHVYEPPDLWTSRAEAKFQDRVPRIVHRDEDDSDWWMCDGRKGHSTGPGSQVGLRFEEPDKLKFADKVENLRPGGYLPEEHVKDMELDGVDVSIVFPTVGLLLYSVPDGDLLNSLFRTYNDWVAEFCQGAPDQIKGVAMLNIDDVQTGITELERCAKMGLAGAMITVYPPPERGYDSPEYEPLWAAAQDLETPLNLHIGTNRPGPGQQFVDIESVKPTFFTNVDYWVRESLGNMIFSGVFERYPRLQVGSIEMELSWATHFLDRMDYTYTQRPHGDWYRFKEDMLPSDYFHRNVFLGFQEDAIGIRDRHIIGVDNLMWGADYPHFESTFPRSQQIIEEILVDCTEEEKDKIVGGNTARVYHLD